MKSVRIVGPHVTILVLVDKLEEVSVEVDKGLFNVEGTLPASLFEGEDIDSAIKEAKAEGVKEVI